MKILFAVIKMILVANCSAAFATETVDQILANEVGVFYPNKGAEFEEFCRVKVIPCGLESLLDPSLPAIVPKDQWPAEHETGKGYLTWLMDHTMKEYAWRAENGLLEFLPRDVQARKTKSPLDTVVDSVDVDDQPVNAAAIQLCHKFGIAKATHAYTATPKGHVTLHLKSVTIRQALNEMVKSDGNSMWIVYGSGKNRYIVVKSWRRWDADKALAK